MYLFINSIIKPSVIFLFSEGTILASVTFDISGHEYDDLLDTIEAFLSDNSISVPSLSGIVVVSGPGGFTSTRIVSLIVNTWRSLYHIPTQSLTLFDVFERAGSTYPMCVKANRGEYLVMSEKTLAPAIVSIAEMPSGSYVGIGDVSDFENQKISIQSHVNYEALIQDFAFTREDRNIEPYYIKKPNIT